MRLRWAAAAIALACASSVAPAVGSEQAFRSPPSNLTLKSSSERVTVIFDRATTAKSSAVAYRVTVSGNSRLDHDSNYQVKTLHSISRTPGGSGREQVAFKIKSPQLYGYGPKIWVQVEAKLTSGSKKRSIARSPKAVTGLTPANPAPTAITVTATCKGFTARWKSGYKPARARGLVVAVAEVEPGGQVLQPVKYRGFEPADSISVASLKPSTVYRIKAQASSVDQRSSWTESHDLKTSSCGTFYRVGTYNTQIYRANKVSWTKYRAARVAKQIKDSKLDLVGVQETLTLNGNMLHTLTDKLGDNWSVSSSSLAGVHLLYNYRRMTAVGVPRQYPDQGDTTAVAQVFDSYVPPEQPPEGYRPEPRFVVVNLHIPKDLTQSQRRAQVRSAMALAAQLKAEHDAPDIPTVFVGDVYLATTEEKRTAVREELSKSMSDAEFYQPGRTLDLYNSRNGLVKCPPHVNGVKVDGIFTSDSVAVSYWNMPKYMFSEGCFRGGFPSDHNPIVANVWLPKVASSSD